MLRIKKNNQAISTTTLYKTLNLPPSNEDIFLDSLYELEQEGKIIYYHNQYIKVPSTSTLYQGKLNISNTYNLQYALIHKFGFIMGMYKNIYQINML